MQFFNAEIEAFFFYNTDSQILKLPNILIITETLKSVIQPSFMNRVEYTSIFNPNHHIYARFLPTPSNFYTRHPFT